MCESISYFDPTNGPLAVESADFFIRYYTDDETNRVIANADEELMRRLVEQRGLEPHQAYLFTQFARDRVIQELF